MYGLAPAPRIISRLTNRWLALAAVIAVALFSAPAAATPLIVYLDAHGSDSNSCLSATSACLTLIRAQRVVESVDPHDDVTVSVANDGTYWGQSVNWIYVMAHHSVSIVGAGPATTSNKAVFDGCSDASLTSCPYANHWFSFETSVGRNGGRMSNLVISNLTIQHYANPLWFVGDRNEVGHGWNGGNTVKDVVFQYIGNCYVPSLAESWGVVNVYNSRHNEFSNIQFLHICTSPYDLNVYLHAYYLATAADYNFITHNTFSDVYGDTIRFRDGANYNTVAHSSFKKTGEDAPLTSWFCHPFDAQICGKKTHECPSLGNRAIDNYFDGGDQGLPIPFQLNLYGKRDCGVSMAKQNVRQKGTTIDYTAWPN